MRLATKEKMMSALNTALTEAKAQIRVEQYTVFECVLNNGMRLNRGAFIKFRRRLKSKLAQPLLDGLYALDDKVRRENEQELLRITARLGGKAVWQEHRETLIVSVRTNLKKARAKGVGWKKGHRSWVTGLTKETDPRLAKLSQDRMGIGNPMFGRPYSESAKKKQSESMRKAIAEGRFTPSVRNSRTHWTSCLDGEQKFRSSWEAAFASLNPLAEYETIRIEYGPNKRIFIVDFVEHQTKMLIEIKPKSHRAKCEAKFLAARAWCNETNYSFMILGEEWLVNHFHLLDESRFDKNTWNSLVKAYEAGKKNANPTS